MAFVGFGVGAVGTFFMFLASCGAPMTHWWAEAKVCQANSVSLRGQRCVVENQEMAHAEAMACLQQHPSFLPFGENP